MNIPNFTCYSSSSHVYFHNEKLQIKNIYIYYQSRNFCVSILIICSVFVVLILVHLVLSSFQTNKKYNVIRNISQVFDTTKTAQRKTFFPICYPSNFKHSLCHFWIVPKCITQVVGSKSRRRDNARL